MILLKILKVSTTILLFVQLKETNANLFSTSNPKLGLEKNDINFLPSGTEGSSCQRDQHCQYLFGDNFLFCTWGTCQCKWTEYSNPKILTKWDKSRRVCKGVKGSGCQVFATEFSKLECQEGLDCNRQFSSTEAKFWGICEGTNWLLYILGILGVVSFFVAAFCVFKCRSTHGKKTREPSGNALGQQENNENTRPVAKTNNAVTIEQVEIINTAADLQSEMPRNILIEDPPPPYNPYDYMTSR